MMCENTKYYSVDRDRSSLFPVPVICDVEKYDKITDIEDTVDGTKITIETMCSQCNGKMRIIFNIGLYNECKVKYTTNTGRVLCPHCNNVIKKTIVLRK